MTTREDTPILDDVLNEFVATYERPSRKGLEAFVRRYPQFERDLVDFAAAWAEQETLAPAANLGPDEEKSVVDRAISHVQNVLYAYDAAAAAAAPAERTTPMVEPAVASDAAAMPISSLTESAKKVGYSPREFASACGLDLLLVGKLEARQIRFRTIPRRLIDTLARLLRHPAEFVAAFLDGPPRIVAGRAFLSRNKPNAAAQQSFADAVRDSRLSEEEKRRWLEESADLDQGS